MKANSNTKTMEELIDELVALLTDIDNKDPLQEGFQQKLKELVHVFIDLIDEKIENNDLKEEDIKNIFESIYRLRISCEHDGVWPNLEIRYEQSEEIVRKATIIRDMDTSTMFPFDESKTGEDIVKDILQCAIDAIKEPSEK